MTDQLRETFDDMLAGEPPLNTSVDETIAAALRLRSRRRHLWTAGGAALVVAAIVTIPGLVARDGVKPSRVAALPSPAASISPTPLTSPSADPAVTLYQTCPHPAATRLNISDGSVLPDAAKLAADALAAGPNIAPGKKFILQSSTRINTSAKNPGTPMIFLIINIGDADGYGSINMQFIPEQGAPPAKRAELELAANGPCVGVTRRDFPDGSVAISYPYQMMIQVWYFAKGGFTIDIGCFPRVWDSNGDLQPPPATPSLPARTSLPLTVSQVMDLADVLAKSR